MTIDDLSNGGGPDIYYNPKFRVVLEDHMTFLRNDTKTKAIEVTNHAAFKYEGDYWGLLSFYNIPVELHWLVMRMNKLTSPVQSSTDIRSFITPNQSVIDRLRGVYLTQNKIKN